MFGLSELALILIVVAVVVGVKKLPELTRSAGKAARILKSETKALKEEGKEKDKEEGRAPDAAAPGERHVVTGIVVDRNDPPVRDSRDRP
ncbi:twin-arginine translocase TatA/TatE family subunit [Streptomyces sp. 35G-GA-8]|uniref:twin-arginine translocase TatA/TatE family subunit n=1 Tax=Streptomyces sp. 35G-GA-8 TaxID=2939434 RepID=UPI00201FAB7B|nr:twin-arginine translocase TatA/TatE family subunit [Streptomyces sp. 35G-GA-8]MCL7380832.1 twin-arginine translocase TatA/TatE family subunit [Streptomyces sp. 35G-GA-8]